MDLMWGGSYVAGINMYASICKIIRVKKSNSRKVQKSLLSVIDDNGRMVLSR
jgi:hypothetical protein